MMQTNVEEHFSKLEGNKDVLIGKEIFNNKEVELKTELNIKEIVIANSLMWNCDYLEEHGLVRLYDEFLQNYFTLKLSHERKSRAEFVAIHKKDKTDEILGNMDKLTNIKGVKK